MRSSHLQRKAVSGEGHCSILCQKSAPLEGTGAGSQNAPLTFTDLLHQALLLVVKFLQGLPVEQKLFSFQTSSLNDQNSCHFRYNFLRANAIPGESLDSLLGADLLQELHKGFALDLQQPSHVLRRLAAAAPAAAAIRALVLVQVDGLDASDAPPKQLQQWRLRSWKPSMRTQTPFKPLSWFGLENGSPRRNHTRRNEMPIQGFPMLPPAAWDPAP